MNKGRKPLIAGNWKMNTMLPEALALAAAAREAAGKHRDREVAVAPPFPWLHAVSEAAKGSALLVAGQDVHHEAGGAYTGEVSVSMLKSAGCTHVIVGHSERRQLFGETDESVNLKVKAALAGRLIPIMCVGETLEQREAGRLQEVVGGQVSGGMRGLAPEAAAGLVVAYEPVWAIGTGRTASSAQAQEAHAFIRGVIEKEYGRAAADAVRIQYGGSVKPDNIDEIMGMPDIDGALVGGASLKADGFARIIGFTAA
jgi:triosephosphate isomerase